MLIDLTAPYYNESRLKIETEEWFLPSEWCDYTGMVYHLNCLSMSSTYIDFPGHIKECADGIAADSYPLEKLVRQEAVVVHLNRKSGSGAVTGAELESAAGNPKSPCLVINGLADGLQPLDIELRTVWFDRSAVDWIISTGCHLLVSDIYEGTKLLGVFKVLFDARISTVCIPWNLWKLPEKALISAVCSPMPGVCQLPCRLFAEI